jgi:flavodoxin
MKKRILVIYHSGVGNTRLVSELLAGRLAREAEVKLHRIPFAQARPDPVGFDFLIFGFPTFYCRPSPSMAEFVDSLPRFAARTPSFIFTTMGLYAENSLRVFARMLAKKNIIPTGYMEVKSPGTDGVLFLPAFLGSLREFEKTLLTKVRIAAGAILSALSVVGGTRATPKIPAYKWYTPLSRAGQLVLDRIGIFKSRMRIVRERCDNCGECVTVCRRGAWNADNARPFFSAAACEF